MKISQELYDSGLLRRNQFQFRAGYEFIGRRAPNLTPSVQEAESVKRRETSTKVSEIGWRVLSDVLRLR